MTGTRKFDNITPILKLLCWLPVKFRLFYRDAVLAFKCMTGCAPLYLTSQFLKRSDFSQKSTRNSQLPNIPWFKSATDQMTFYYRIVTLWNSLDSDLKLCKTVAGFKRKLKQVLLDNFFRILANYFNTISSLLLYLI